MQRLTIEDIYFDWLYDKVCDVTYTQLSYERLFKKLFNTPFIWVLDLDENRELDGIELRYDFLDEYRYAIDDDLDFLDAPGNVLEVLIALAIRCEMSVAYDDDYGNRAGQWFWTMLVNIGLGDMSDQHYDDNRADVMLDIFLNRRYGDNELGCPFVVKHPKAPMRETHLWKQMNWYLSDIL